ncbi:piggyBac transposable element-derived protein 4-like [Macrobrachium nipponense]|uniref:piggyBac transposable element-derived protein 4-like n=1 Tax=Macrobrachium nipponense TaxID=159736 RepID=UPI0030C8D093
MRAFIGIALIMGIVRLPGINDYWDTCHKPISQTWFREHFERDRFKLLLKFLHFANNDGMPAQDSQDYDPLYKNKPVIDYFVHVFKRHFHPSQNITIDESMVSFRGRTPHLRQYMPQKRHARFGVKLWCLCDTKTGYTHTFEVYKEVRQGDRSEEGFIYNLVMSDAFDEAG